MFVRDNGLSVAYHLEGLMLLSEIYYIRIKNYVGTCSMSLCCRYVAAGKHIGKVLVHVRPKEDKRVFVPVPWLMQAYPRYFCNPSYTYIITGTQLSYCMPKQN